MLSIGDFLKREFANIIPMLHILGLPEEGNGSLGTKSIILRHVEIINKVNEFDLSRRTVLFACLFDQLLFQHVLEIASISVVVEVDHLVVVLVDCVGHRGSSYDFSKHTKGQGGFTTTGVTDQKHRVLHV